MSTNVFADWLNLYRDPLDSSAVPRFRSGAGAVGRVSGRESSAAEH
jgi:hypothetical protein